jgi:hypothetical protein
MYCLNWSDWLQTIMEYSKVRENERVWIVHGGHSWLSDTCYWPSEKPGVSPLFQMDTIYRRRRWELGRTSSEWFRCINHRQQIVKVDMEVVSTVLEKLYRLRKYQILHLSIDIVSFVQQFLAPYLVGSTANIPSPHDLRATSHDIA